MKYSKVIKQLKKENEALAEATEPILELAAKFNISPEKVLDASAGADLIEAVEDKIMEVMENG